MIVMDHDHHYDPLFGDGLVVFTVIEFDDTCNNPVLMEGAARGWIGPFQVFHGSTARVVLNPETGRIVTVNPVSRAGVR